MFIIKLSKVEKEARQGKKWPNKSENSSRMNFLIQILSTDDNGKQLMHLLHVCKQEDSLSSSWSKHSYNHPWAFSIT